MPNTNKRLLAEDEDSRRFVQFQRISKSGFVEFAFGLGSPDLMVDLIMPAEQYKEFCAVNKVVCLTDEEQQLLRQEQNKWRYGKAVSESDI